jgi:nucleoside recognition membrane protein YjiH
MNKTAYMYEYVINNLKKYIAVFIQKLLLIWFSLMLSQ